jgi:cobalt-zinc-cadmium efflux system protein
MTHQHSHDGHRINNAFKIGILINLIFISTEVFYGYLSNSVALIADAGHNFSDVVALSFSWLAIIVSHRKPTLRYTYGFRRATILAAILNTIVLVTAIALITWEAISRFKITSIVKGNTIVLVACAGIIVNGITAWLFFNGKDHDLNIKSAFLHFLTDTLVSFGVVIAGIIITFSGMYWIDPLISLLIVGFILYNSYGVLTDSINLSLDAVPKNIDLNAISDYFLSYDHVTSIHDLHVWALSTSETALTVHIVSDNGLGENFISAAQIFLADNFKIKHSTIQVEKSELTTCQNNCN